MCLGWAGSPVLLLRLPWEGEALARVSLLQVTTVPPRLKLPVEKLSMHKW